MDKDAMAKIIDGIPKSRGRKMWEVLYDFGNHYASSANNILSVILKDPDFIAPMLMCRFFSVELMLKFFLVVDHRSVSNEVGLKAVGVELHGHKYTPLFDKINSKYKRAIAESFSAISGKSTSEAEFRSLLSQFENGFVKWRYIYEEAENPSFVDLQALQNVNDALGKCAEEQARRWGHIPPAR
jgi:hypothetical protein